MGKAIGVTVVLVVIAGIVLYLLNGDAKEAAKTLGSSIGFIVLFFVGMVAVFYKSEKVAFMQPK